LGLSCQSACCEDQRHARSRAPAASAEAPATEARHTVPAQILSLMALRLRRETSNIDGNKFQRCQSALSHYRKRPPAGGSKAQMDCEPFMPDALRDRTAWLG